jgi:hypothetical protein
MLSLLLKLLPASRSGSVRASAQAAVDKALGANRTKAAYQRSLMTRVIFWGGLHPVWFSLAMTSFWAGVALVFHHATLHPSWVGSALTPHIPADKTVAEFFSPVWGVQATIVALVYPIVLSFVAIVLQRRASSKVLLRVYILESGVSVAGGSSLCLTAAMAMQYLLSPYAGREMLLPGLVFNGGWLLSNLYLTAVFLSRTVRFLEEEEGQRSMTRVAVDHVLSRELSASLAQQMYLTLGEGWKQSGKVGQDSVPRLGHAWSEEDGTKITVSIRRSSKLVDVNSVLLLRVVSSWARRLPKPPTSDARLTFVPDLSDREELGKVVLCMSPASRPLTRFERSLVRAAFVYRSAGRELLNLSTIDMLREMALEAQSLAEQRRFTASTEALSGMVAFHGTLLAACVESDAGVPSNAAALTRSAYAFGEGSFHSEWMREYRPLVALSVTYLEDEPDLFRSLAYLPSNLERLAPGQPWRLLNSSLLIPAYQTYRLGVWWTRRMQSSGAVGTGAAAVADQGMTLAEPHATVYRNGLISFLGGWSSLRVTVPSDVVDHVRWWHLCTRTHTYLHQLEHSANFLLDAVQRYDSEAATWFCDHLVKWWGGGREFELKVGDLDWDPRFRLVGVGLADLSWTEAQEFLDRLGGHNPDDRAEQALNLAVRHYWEGLTLVVACLLLAAVPEEASGAPLAVKIAGQVLSREQINAGNYVQERPLSTPDEVLAAFLSACFNDPCTTRRLDRFCESRQRDTDAPMVPGWMYGGSVPRSDVESLVTECAIIMAACTEDTRRGWPDVRGVIGQLWRDTLLLDSVQRFGDQLKATARRPLGRRLGLIRMLRERLRRPQQHGSVRGHVFAGGAFAVARAAEEQALTLRFMAVSPSRLRALSEDVAAALFNPTAERGDHPFCTVQWGEAPQAKRYSAIVRRFQIEELFISPLREFSKSDVQQVAQWLRIRIVYWAIRDMFTDKSIQPVTATSGQTLVAAVAAACTKCRNDGSNPIVLVPGSKQSLFRPSTAGLVPGIRLARPPNDDASGANFFLNSVPGFVFPTPSDECYVVDRELVASVRVHGTSPATSFKVSEVGREQKRTLRLQWEWFALAG